MEVHVCRDREREREVGGGRERYFQYFISFYLSIVFGSTTLLVGLHVAVMKFKLRLQMRNIINKSCIVNQYKMLNEYT